MNCPIKFLALTPFDSRLRLGHSQQDKTLRLFWLIDQTPLSQQRQIFSALLAGMQQNQLVTLTLASYLPINQTGWVQLLADLRQTQPLSNDFDFDFANASPISSSIKEKRFIKVCQIETELTLIRHLDQTRLILDLSATPNLFLQIAGISAGIPQINQVPTSYVKSYQNGIVLQKLAELPQALSYYLVGLTHWNQALVYATTQIKRFSSEHLIHYWNQLQGVSKP